MRTPIVGNYMTDKAQTAFVGRTKTQSGTLGNRNLCANVSAFENFGVVISFCFRKLNERPDESRT
jgi:hypothetical protein